MSGNVTSLGDGVALRRQVDTLTDFDPFDIFGWGHTMAPQDRPAMRDRYTTLVRITQVYNRGDLQIPSLAALNRFRDAFLESWANVVRRTRGRNSDTWNPDISMDFQALRRPRPSRTTTSPMTSTRSRPLSSHRAAPQASPLAQRPPSESILALVAGAQDARSPLKPRAPLLTHRAQPASVPHLCTFSLEVTTTML